MFHSPLHLLGPLLAQISTPRQVSSHPGSFQLPPQASEAAARLDSDYMFIYWINVLFTVLIFGALFLFIWKYHKRKHPVAAKLATHNTVLELTWSILPMFVLAYMFWIGFVGFMDTRTPPRNAREIQVTGQKWNWTFSYNVPGVGSFQTDELHVPVNEPVVLVMSSEDVLHSFFIPAFRCKQDVVPGRYTKQWFTATMPGEYTAFCAEYCGTKHSNMMAPVTVHEPGQFEVWLANAVRFDESMPLEERGKVMVKRLGCGQCHSVDGTALTGPSWVRDGKSIFGITEKLKDGSTVEVDENYIMESIKNPGAKIVAGYDNVMSAYAGRVKDEEISYIIAYMKSLGTK